MSEVRLVQILGTNGAGKSALLKALAAKDPMCGLPADMVPGQDRPMTFLPRLRFVLIGDYVTSVNTPGADAIHSKVELLHALDIAAGIARANLPMAVAWEGIIIMTRQYHHEYLQRGLTPLYVVLRVPIEECFNRIRLRSGKSREDLSGNGKIVEDRAHSVDRLAEWLTEQGGEMLWLDGKEFPDVNAGRLLRTVWAVQRKSV